MSFGHDRIIKYITELIAYRGCTTPLVLSHLVKAVFEKDNLTGDENFDEVDGYEELPEDYQETVRAALIQGHVDDDDWKGVSTYNSSDLTSVDVSLSLTANLRTLSAIALACVASVSPRRRPLLRRLFVIHESLSFYRVLY